MRQTARRKLLPNELRHCAGLSGRFFILFYYFCRMRNSGSERSAESRRILQPLRTIRTAWADEP